MLIHLRPFFRPISSHPGMDRACRWLGSPTTPPTRLKEGQLLAKRGEKIFPHCRPTCLEASQWQLLGWRQLGVLSFRISPSRFAGACRCWPADISLSALGCFEDKEWKREMDLGRDERVRKREKEARERDDEKEGTKRERSMERVTERKRQESRGRNERERWDRGRKGKGGERKRENYFCF